MHKDILVMAMMSSYHKKVIFVPGCLLAPGLQAGNEEKNWIWTRNWMAFLSKIDCNIVQMPCPESSFDCADCGLGRKPHGVGFYEALPGFYEHCLSLSREVAKDVYKFKLKGYDVSAVLGIEHSPTCAVNYMYTHRGMVKRPGIFMGEIMNALGQVGVSVPIVGINRRYPQKSIIRVEELTACSKG